MTLTSTLAAQNRTDTTSTAASKEMDVGDFFRKVFKKHPGRQTDSAQLAGPKKVNLSVVPAAGYSLQTGFAVVLSSDFAFKTDTPYRQKASNLLASISYTQYNQVIFPLVANIWSKKNKYNYQLDYRFLRYPSKNYGIGPNTTEQDAYTLNFNYLKLHQSVLKRISGELYTGIGLYYDRFWKITEVDPPAGVRTSFHEYDSSNRENAVGIALKLLYDSRLNQVNPSGGTYANMVFRPNFTFLGSDNSWQSLQIDLRKYVRIFGSKKNILALWSYNWFTFGKGKPPYLLLPATGWDDQYNTGRGYIQGRFRANNMVYGEMEYRFQVTHNGLLGGVVFVNAQTLSVHLKDQFNFFAPGYGLGVRIKINKFSKANLTVDYGFGLNGSKGLFLNLGEVF
jgi:outer membrane protein assembly factor BamA